MRESRRPRLRALWLRMAPRPPLADAASAVCVRTGGVEEICLSVASLRLCKCASGAARCCSDEMVSISSSIGGGRLQERSRTGDEGRERSCWAPVATAYTRAERRSSSSRAAQAPASERTPTAHRRGARMGARCCCRRPTGSWRRAGSRSLALGVAAVGWRLRRPPAVGPVRRAAPGAAKAEGRDAMDGC